MGCQNAKAGPKQGEQAAASNPPQNTGQANPPPPEQSKLLANPPPNQSNAKSPVPPRDPNAGSTSLIVPGQEQNKKPSEVREVQLKNSKVTIKSEKLMQSEQMVSASGIKSFNNEEFKGKKVRKFNISADIPEKNYIKESNYFDESNGDLQVRSKIPSRYADFSVGTFDQLNTFPVKTYLYDHALNAKLTA